MNIPYISLVENSKNEHIIISTNSECIICADILDNKELIVLRCKHTFHLKCIELWFKYKRTCPYCRENINKDEDENGEKNKKVGVIIFLFFFILLFCIVLIICFF